MRSGTGMKNKNALVFCKNIDSLQKNEKHLIKYNYVFLVSPDIRLKEYVWGRSKMEFVPFCSDKGIFCEDTWHIIDTINDQIESLKLKNSAYLYKGNYLIEGGFAGSIADILYGIDIFQKIIYNNKVDVVYCDRNCESEDILALQAVTMSKKIKFSFLSGGIRNISELKRWIFNSYYPGLGFIISFKVVLDSLIHIIKISRQNKKDKKDTQYDLAIILVSNANKHINWLINSLKNFSEDLHYCIFCMKADDAKNKLIKCGKEAKSVEAYFKMRFFWQSIFTYVKDVCLISRTIKNELSCSFQNTDIKKVIVSLYIRNLREEKLFNIIYEKVVLDFLKLNRPYLLTGDGDTNFISNQIFYYAVKKLGMVSKFYKDNTGIDIINVKGRIFEPYAHIMEIRFFTKGSTYLEALLSNGWNGKVFYLSDLVYLESFRKYKNIVHKFNKKINILWAPSYPFKGHYSLQSFLLDNEFIIKECKDKDVELYIKYHPNQDEFFTNEFKKQCRNINNIHFINKEKGIEDYIENSDIVITTPSTVIIDAALKKKLVICLIDAYSYHLVEHMESGFILIKREQLQLNEYIKFAMEKSAMNGRYNYFLKKQENYINKFYESDTNVNEILLEIINSLKKEDEVRNNDKFANNPS